MKIQSEFVYGVFVDERGVWKLSLWLNRSRVKTYSNHGLGRGLRKVHFYFVCRRDFVEWGHDLQTPWRSHGRGTQITSGGVRLHTQLKKREKRINVISSETSLRHTTFLVIDGSIDDQYWTSSRTKHRDSFNEVKRLGTKIVSHSSNLC